MKKKTNENGGTPQMKSKKASSSEDAKQSSKPTPSPSSYLNFPLVPLRSKHGGEQGMQEPNRTAHARVALFERGEGDNQVTKRERDKSTLHLENATLSASNLSESSACK